MAKVFNFEGLEVYKKSLGLVVEIYELTDEWPREYQYNLTDQIRRAILSIVLNIAEGSSRTKKDFSRFIDLSRGSLFESKVCLEIAKRRNLIKEEELVYFENSLTTISKMLSGLKAFLKRS